MCGVAVPKCRYLEARRAQPLMNVFSSDLRRPSPRSRADTAAVLRTWAARGSSDRLCTALTVLPCRAVPVNVAPLGAPSGAGRRGAGRAVRGSEARGRRPRHVVPPRPGVGRLRAGRRLRALLRRGREQAAGPRGRRASPGGLRRRSPRSRRAAGLAAAAARRLLPAGPGLDRAARGRRRLLGQQLGPVRAAARGAARGRAEGAEANPGGDGGGRGALRSERLLGAARPDGACCVGAERGREPRGPGAPRRRNPADILQAPGGAAPRSAALRRCALWVGAAGGRAVPGGCELV